MKTLYGNELLNELINLFTGARKRIWICSPYVGNIEFISKISNSKIIKGKIDKRFITDIKELSNLNFEFF